MICIAKIYTKVHVYPQGKVDVHINFEGMTLRKPPHGMETSGTSKMQKITTKKSRATFLLLSGLQCKSLIGGSLESP